MLTEANKEYDFPRYICFGCALEAEDIKLPRCDIKEGKCDICGEVKPDIVEAKDFGYPTFKDNKNA